MNCILQVAYFLAALLKAGYCLQCITREETSVNGFSWSSVSCQRNEVCLTIFERFGDLENSNSKIISKCASPEHCDQSFTLILENQRVTISSRCCDTDYCKISEPKGLPNGIKCPSCYSVGGNQCSPRGIMECTGTEDICYSYIFPGGPKEGPFSTRGCTTRMLCNGIRGTIVPPQYQNGRVSCNQIAHGSCGTLTKLGFNLLFVLSLLLTLVSP